MNLWFPSGYISFCIFGYLCIMRIKKFTVGGKKMKKDTFPMTESGLEKMKQELGALETVKRENAKQRVKHARGFCDFQEDSEYEMALIALANIEDRISTLKYKIQQAKIIRTTEKIQVELGSTVSFKEVPNGDLETYTIVGTEEANPLEGKISNDSPMAKSVIGAKVHDEVMVTTPGGKWWVKIVDIS